MSKSLKFIHVFYLKKHVSAYRPCRTILTITHFGSKITNLFIWIYIKISLNINFSSLFHCICSRALMILQGPLSPVPIFNVCLPIKLWGTTVNKIDSHFFTVTTGGNRHIVELWYEILYTVIHNLCM